MSAPASDLSLVVRPMTVADLDAVVQVENSSYDFPWQRENFMDCLFLRYRCLLLEYRQTLCAYAIMALIPGGNAHLLNICVRPDYRRMGFGTHMMHHLFVLARTHNVKYLSLEVRASNIAGRVMYQRLGFVCQGLKRDYYLSADGREDAMILAHSLLSGLVVADDP